MITVLFKNKNGELKKKTYKEAIEPQFHNPIYQKSGNYGCKWCVGKTGRKKNFSNLWLIYLHGKTQHPHEKYRELTMNLAKLIMDGVLLWLKHMKFQLVLIVVRNYTDL